MRQVRCRLPWGIRRRWRSTARCIRRFLGIFSLLALGFVIPLLADCRRDLLKGILPALITAFFAFKSGMVRQDDFHTAILQVKLAVAGVFLLVCVRNMRDRRLLLPTW